MVALCDWPGRYGGLVGYLEGGQTMWPAAVMSDTRDIPQQPPARRASDYFILQAFYELSVINRNDSAVFYQGNKENSQMRSRTK